MNSVCPRCYSRCFGVFPTLSGLMCEACKKFGMQKYHVQYNSYKGDRHTTRILFMTFTEAMELWANLVSLSDIRKIKNVYMVTREGSINTTYPNFGFKIKRLRKTWLGNKHTQNDWSWREN